MVAYKKAGGVPPAVKFHAIIMLSNMLINENFRVIRQ